MNCPCPKHPTGCYLHPIGCGCENERLRAELVDNAVVIGRLNSGEELQSLMKTNNDLRAQLASADEACQRLCGLHGYATGHGDTVADMIDEISAQISLTDDTGKS